MNIFNFANCNKADKTDTKENTVEIAKYVPSIPGIKILCISDTHGLHSKMSKLPDADVLIHGGDMTSVGTKDDIESFVKWFDSLNYPSKYFIAGNHETSIDTDYYVASGANRFHLRLANQKGFDAFTYSQQCRGMLM